MPERVIVAALVFFGVGALLGAAFVLVAPISFMRGLGLVALGIGLAGCALELYALHEYAPKAYVALRDEWHAIVRGLKPRSAHWLRQAPSA